MESPYVLRNEIRQLPGTKIALKDNGAIQFEPTKNANIFKDFYSGLAGNLVKKLPVALNKFNNNLTKEYYMNIDKICHNFELCKSFVMLYGTKLSQTGNGYHQKTF